jgi:hypothetical protein
MKPWHQFERLLEWWPQVVPQERGTQPIYLDDYGALAVFCVDQAVVDQLMSSAGSVVAELNSLARAPDLVTKLHPVVAGKDVATLSRLVLKLAQRVEQLEAELGAIQSGS